MAPKSLLTHPDVALAGRKMSAADGLVAIADQLFRLDIDSSERILDAAEGLLRSARSDLREAVCDERLGWEERAELEDLVRRLDMVRELADEFQRSRPWLFTSKASTQ